MFHRTTPGNLYIYWDERGMFEGECMIFEDIVIYLRKKILILRR